MIFYREQDGRINREEWQRGVPIPTDVIWVDLLCPTREEELLLEDFLGLDVPTREEMVEIEVSNRLYQEGGAQFMTATLLSKVDTGEPETHAVTFIVTDCRLVTIRYVDTTSFRRFAGQLVKLPGSGCDGATLALGLLDSVVNRTADVLERLDREIDRITKEIFRPRPAGERRSTTDYQVVLERIGRCGDLSSKIHESLVTLGRVAAYAAHNKKMALPENDNQLVSIRKDIAGLSDHGAYLTGRVNFLLDATLGMVTIEQNVVIKVLSIASLVFLPPTLVAGIYGMNFKLMPELNWHWGYPLAMVLMVFSAVLPYAYLKQRKWL
jgi:magnesium transporter